MEIVLKDVSYRYKNKKLLDKVNLIIEDNFIIGITGECKTLLCELVSGKKQVSSGIIMLDNISIKEITPKKIRKEVSYVYQDIDKQFYTNKVEEEIIFLLSRLDYHPKDISKKICQALQIVGLDDSYIEREIEGLSTGEKKLLQIAISLISNPSVIIFDEPFTGLDYKNKKQLAKLIKNLKEKYNKTVIIASNDNNLLYELTDNIVVLKKGSVLVNDKTTKVFQNIDLLNKNKIKIPDLIMFTMLAKDKKVKLSYHTDIRDLIKDVYKHV